MAGVQCANATPDVRTAHYANLNGYEWLGITYFPERVEMSSHPDEKIGQKCA
jgi:hypothetical protein